MRSPACQNVLLRYIYIQSRMELSTMTVSACLLAALVCVGLNAGHAHLIDLEVHGSAAEGRVHRLDICTLAERGSRIKINSHDSKIVVAGGFSLVRDLQLTAPNAVTQVVDVNRTRAELNTSVLNIASGYDWVHVGVQLVDRATCGKCALEFYTDDRSQRGPWECIPCPAAGASVAEICSQYSSSEIRDMCLHESGLYGASAYFLSCPPMAGFFSRCAGSTVGWVFDQNTTMPRSQKECERLQVCRDRGWYRDPRIAGDNCIECQDHGPYGMRGQARADGVGVGVVGMDREATCVCPAGKYYSSISGVCLMCPVGKYQAHAGLNTSCDACDKCSALSLGSISCKDCSSGTYWSYQLKRCHSCPVSRLSLQKNKDFESVSFDAEMQFINLSACGDPAKSSLCQEPGNIISSRRECGPGQESKRYSDAADDVCVDCENGKFNALSRVGAICKDQQVCSGFSFESHASGSARSDVTCDYENISATFFRYPIHVPTTYSLSIVDKEFTVYDRNRRPTLFLKWNAATTISWPPEHAIAIFNSSSFKHRHPGVNMDYTSRQTTITILESEAKNTTLYYRSEDDFSIPYGELRVVHVEGDAATFEQTSFHGHRKTSLLQGTRVECTLPVGVVRSEYYVDVLAQAWEENAELLLPMLGIAPCVFTCRQGSEKVTNACVECKAGQYSSTQSGGKCLPCPAGKFQASSGQLSCQDCPLGKFSNVDGSTACQEHCAIHDAERCAIPECDPRTSYLIHSNISQSDRPNCRKCPDDTSVVDKSEWVVYGESHCFSVRGSCNITDVIHAESVENEHTCKPSCDANYFARYDSQDASWECVACDRSVVVCGAGQYISSGCTGNQNYQCLDCEGSLAPFSRYLSDSAAESQNACKENAMCRVDGMILSDSDESLSFVSSLSIRTQNDFWKNLKNDRCIVTTLKGLECPEPRQHLELQCQNFMLDASEQFFQPHDQSESGNYLVLQCVTDSAECRKAKSPCKMSGEDVASVVNNCREYFEVDSRRRLLQTSESDCSLDMYWHDGRKQCVACPDNTQREPDTPSDLSKCVCKSGYRDGDAETAGCIACERGKRFYCPGGSDIQCPLDPDPTLPGSCPCPGNSSTLFGFARDFDDCVAEAGHFIYETTTKSCPVYGHEYLTEPIRQGVGIITECYARCRTDRFALNVATNNAPGNVTCECDPGLHRVWSAQDGICVCDAGTFEDDGQCRPCLENHFCSGRGEMQSCPETMIAPMGSTSEADCGCDKGMHRPGNAQVCNICTPGSYCPDGFKRVLCTDQAVSLRFICDAPELWKGSTCDPGTFSDKDYTVAQTRADCIDGTSLKRLYREKAYLYINHIMWDYELQQYKAVIHDVESILGIDDAAVQEMHETFEFSDQNGLKRYGHNFQFFGLMAATYQWFCGIQPVMVVANGGTGTGNMEQESVLCVGDVNGLRSLHFVDTARFVPQISELGPMGIFDPVSVYAVREVFTNIYMQPQSHVTFGMFMDCASDRPVGLNMSSELSICTGSCASSNMIMRVDQKHRLPDGGAWVEMPLDAPSQYMLARHWGETGHVFAWYMVMADGTGVQFLFFVYTPDGLVQKKSFMKTTKQIKFILPLRTWRPFPASDVGAFVGICDESSSRFTLHRFDFVPGVMHETYAEVDGVANDICALGASEFIAAHMHLNHLDIFVHGHRDHSVAKILNIYVKDTEHKGQKLSRVEEQWDEKNCRGECGSGNQLLEKCEQRNFCTISAVKHVDFVTNCVQVAAETNPVCRSRLFVLSEEKSNADETLDTLSMLDFDTRTFDNKLNRKILLEGNVLAKKIAGSGLYMGDYVDQMLCQRRQVCDGARILLHTVISRSNFRGWYDSDHDDDIDVILALSQHKDNARGFFVHVRFTSETVKSYRVLSPFFMESAMQSMRYHLVPLRSHEMYTNLLGVRGRVVVTTERGSVVAFKIECVTCDQHGDSKFSAESQSCVCSSGFAPVSFPCTGLACHENTDGILQAPGLALRSSTFIGADPEIETADAYVNRCEICGGLFYCSDGSKSGVLACPNGTYAPVDRSAGVRHCFCDSGTAAVGRGALTGADGGSGCQSCLENEICNAVNNRREKAVSCLQNSRLVVKSQRQTMDTDIFECVCNDGFHSVAVHRQIDKVSLGLWTREYQWPPDSLLAQIQDSVRTRVFNVTRHMCEPCPSNSYCSSSVRNQCPNRATSEPRSTSLSDCLCPQNYRMDQKLSQCVSCLDSPKDVCANNQHIQCALTPNISHHVDVLCPSVKVGHMRVPGVGLVKCPANHYCPPNVTDVLQSNVAVRCPLHSKSSPGSFTIQNCSCPDDSYKVAIGTGLRLFECKPCPSGFHCDGSFALPCSGSHCKDSACEAEAGAAQDEQCEDGFVRKSVVDGDWKAYKAGFLFDDHPLSADYRVAHKQYQTYVQGIESQAACVLCPPGLCCSQSEMTPCSTKQAQFLTVMMGAHDRSTHLTDCPGTRNTTRRAQRSRVGLSSCFDSALLFSSQNKRSQYREAMLLHPVGALLFEQDESILDDTVWRYLLRADMESFHNASYGFQGSNVRRAELLNGNRLVLFEIDIPRVMLAFYARIGEARRRELFQALAILDANTGVAFETLLPCVWALTANSNSLLFPDGKDGRHFGEAVILMNGIAKSVTALHVAREAAKTIFSAWNYCRRHLRTASRIPRIVFSTHAEQVTLPREERKPDLIFAHRAVCSWSNRGGQKCENAFDGVAVSTVSVLKSTLSLAFDINEYQREENLLFSELDFHGDLVGQGLYQDCPKGMVPVSSPVHNMKNCKVCSERDYEQLYFDFVSSSCKVCNVADAEDCSSFPGQTPVLCSFTRDGGCA